MLIRAFHKEKTSSKEGFFFFFKLSCIYMGARSGVFSENPVPFVWVVFSSFDVKLILVQCGYKMSNFFFLEVLGLKPMCNQRKL